MKREMNIEKVEVTKSNYQNKLKISKFWKGVDNVIGLKGRGAIVRESIKSRELITELDIQNKQKVDVWIFKSDGKFILMWQFLSGLASFYCVIEVPVRLAFLTGRQLTVTQQVLEYSVVSIFLTDILVSFNVPIIDQETQNDVNDRLLIFINYMKFWFWFDVMSALPFDLIVNNASDGTDSAPALYFFRILRIFRIVKLFKLGDILKQKLDHLHIDKLFISAIMLMVQVCIVMHLCACGWYYIALTNSSQRNWVENSDLSFKNSTVIDKYVAALYFSAYSLLTVGCGDIHPTNTTEMGYAIAAMLVGSLLFGAIISRIRDVIDSRNLIASDVRKKEEEFNSFLDLSRIPKSLKREAKVI